MQECHTSQTTWSQKFKIWFASTMRHSRMAALFRLLLDAGIVPGGEEEQA